MHRVLLWVVFIAGCTGGSSIDAGTSESGTFAVDINNTVRPQNSVWDIGAYEFLVGSPAVLGGKFVLGGLLKAQ